jgi:hypothetical protein
MESEGGGGRRWPDLSFTRDFFSEMVAENGESFNWKFKFDDLMLFRMVSKVLEAAILGSKSEVVVWYIFLSGKSVAACPQSDKNMKQMDDRPCPSLGTLKGLDI